MITDSILQIVDDAVQFRQTELGQRMDASGQPSDEWRRVKIFTHRQAGHTTAALTLLDRYPPSLIIAANHSMAHSYRRMALDKGLVAASGLLSQTEEFLDPKAGFKDYLVAQSSINRHWFDNQTHRKLIILDPAGMIEEHRDGRGRHFLRPAGYNEFCDRLLKICDVLVELE